MAAAPPATGALEAWVLPATGLLVPGLAASDSVGDEADPGGDSTGASVAGVSIVAVVDLGVSTVRVVLDPGEGTAEVCTPEDPAEAPADAAAEEPSPDDPGAAALMFSVKRSS